MAIKQGIYHYFFDASSKNILFFTSVSSSLFCVPASVQVRKAPVPVVVQVMFVFLPFQVSFFHVNKIMIV